MLHYRLSMPSTSNFQLHYCFVECSHFIWWHGRIHERGDFQVSLSGYISHKNKQQSPFFWLSNVSTRRMSLVVLLDHVFSLAARGFVCCTLIHRFCGNTPDFSSRICTEFMSLFGSHFHWLFLWKHSYPGHVQLDVCIQWCCLQQFLMYHLCQ